MTAAAASSEALAKPSGEGLVILLRCAGCGELKDRRELANYDAVQAGPRDRYRYSVRLCASCRHEAE